MQLTASSTLRDQLEFVRHLSRVRSHTSFGTKEYPQLTIQRPMSNGAPKKALRTFHGLGEYIKPIK